MHFLAVMFLLISPPSQQQAVNVGNVFSPLGGDRYSWTVWIAEPAPKLQEIKCVEYTLHPTFPSPVRTQCDSKKAFSLTAAGWGEFTIYLRITWKDGHETKQSYPLDLTSPDRRIGEKTSLNFPALETHRLSPNSPETLRWPGFAGKVAVSTGKVTVHAGKPKLFHLYVYVAPSPLPSGSLSLSTIKKLGVRTSIVELPGKATFLAGTDQYAIESLETDKDGAVLIVVRPKS
jgi:hypothetical protein